MKTKKIISLILSLLLIITVLPMASIDSNAATNHTLAEAVEWIKARGNENWWQDVDGAYGCQCVDLIKAYYQYLVGYSISGHAKDYLQTSKLPSGWWIDSTPSEGAIIVWGANTWTGQWTTGANGHVGLVYSVSGSNVYTVETNTGGTNGQGDAAAAKFRTRVNCNAKYIHPDFPSTQIPAISYSSITPGEYYIENGNGMILTTASNNTNSGTIVNVWDFIANPGYRVNITGSSEGYKLRFSNCADNIAINAYSDSPNNGTTVNIREYTNNSTQWWRFESVGNGYYAIRNAYNPSVCLTLNPDSGNHGNVTLQTYTGSTYQRWALHPYTTGTITYNANGGNGAPTSQEKHYRENLILSSVTPNRSGYTFAGWATSATSTLATYVAGGTYSNESAVTLYAVWRKNPATVSSIAIESEPSKTTYTVGETFSSNGLLLNINMSDGTSKTVTSGFTLSLPDMSTEGTKTVTVTYEGQSTTFMITVKAVDIRDTLFEKIPDGADPDDYEEVTEYRSSDKVTTESPSTSLDGWTRYDKRQTSWGGTQGAVYSDPSNGERKVWSEQYITSTTTYYNYYHRHISSTSCSPSYTQAQWDAGQVHLIRLTYQLEYKGNSSESSKKPYYGYYKLDGCPNIWYQCGTFETYENTYGTRWYYQEPIYTYFYYKWSDWTSWSTTPIEATDSKRVETRKGYRLKENASPSVVSSITVQSKPTKTVYTVGETFSSSGLSIKVNMSDGTSKTVTSGFTVSSPNMTAVGTKTVTVTYGGKTAVFTISVKSDTTKPSIRLETETAFRSQRIKIPVTVEETDLNSFEINITYDSTKLKIVSVDEIPFISHYSNIKTVGKIRIMASGDACACTGRIAVLTFDVISPEAAVTDISISVDEAYDANDNSVDFDVLDGMLEISSELAGDVDGDGIINSNDYAILRSYVQCQSSLTEEQRMVADFDGDGVVDAFDAIALDVYIHKNNT